MENMDLEVICLEMAAETQNSWGGQTPKEC